MSKQFSQFLDLNTSINEASLSFTDRPPGLSLIPALLDLPVSGLIRIYEFLQQGANVWIQSNCPPLFRIEDHYYCHRIVRGCEVISALIAPADSSVASKLVFKPSFLIYHALQHSDHLIVPPFKQTLYSRKLITKTFAAFRNRYIPQSQRVSILSDFGGCTA